MASDGQARAIPLGAEATPSRRSLSVLNPATEEVAARVADAGPREARIAVERAVSAFESWRRVPPVHRSRLLLAGAERLESEADELARTVTLENGKPLAEALSEVNFAVGYLRWFAEEGRRAYGQSVPSPDPARRLLTTLEPVGVVGAITPWNFPATMVTRKIAPALAAGCTVVLKPAEETPLTALAIARALSDAGLPEGVLTVLPSSRPAEIARVFYEHPAVRRLSFTGSTDVGREVMKGAAATLKGVGLELGGNAPAIVFDDADLELAVDEIVTVKFRRVGGQSCIAANRIYVHEAVYAEFLEMLLEAVGDLRIGDGLHGDTDLGPLINDAGVRKVRRLVADAEARGGVTFRGEAPDGRGYWHPATVVDGASEEMLLAREEIFGPVAPLYRFSDEEEAVIRANDTPFGLAAYLFTRDLDRAFRVGEAIEAGFVGVNDGHGYVHEVPFGGYKESGLGREGGSDGLREYMETKTWSMRSERAAA